MYLQNAIKDKTAKVLIASLTKSRDHYDEAVKCLQERYDCPSTSNPSDTCASHS